MRDSYEDFLDEHFAPSELSNPLISGEEADPDGDGLVNLLGHGFGTHPRVASVHEISVSNGPGVQPDPSISVTWDPSAGYAYEHQMSTTLDGDFVSIPFVEVNAPSGDLLGVTLGPDTSLDPLGSRAFFRLKVE